MLEKKDLRRENIQKLLEKVVHTEMLIQCLLASLSLLFNVKYTH